MVWAQGGFMSDKKEKVLRLVSDYNMADVETYNAHDVHDAIKKSINNESIEMIKADLVAYFGLELDK